MRIDAAAQVQRTGDRRPWPAPENGRGCDDNPEQWPEGVSEGSAELAWADDLVRGRFSLPAGDWLRGTPTPPAGDWLRGTPTPPASGCALVRERA